MKMNKLFGVLTILIYSVSLSAKEKSEAYHPLCVKSDIYSSIPVNTANTQTACCQDRQGDCGCKDGRTVCCDGELSEECSCTLDAIAQEKLN